MPTALARVERVEPQMIESVQAAVADQPDTAASTAVAACRPATRHELLPPEGDTAAAAAPTLNVENGLIDEDQDC